MGVFVDRAAFAELKVWDNTIGEPLGDEDVELDVKTKGEMVATYVAAAFDSRLEGEQWNGMYLEDGNGMYLEDGNVHDERVREAAKGRMMVRRGCGNRVRSL